VFILLFKNVLEISNFEKSAKTSKILKNIEKTSKRNFKKNLCRRFYWGGQNFINKKGLFNAKFFEFEVKS
jgi:hypothetical protein